MKFDNAKFIHFQCDAKLKDELQVEAKSKGLTLNAYIRMILIERAK